MIALARTIPKKLIYYDMLKRRALNPTEHAKQFAQTKAGYEGECRLDREWLDAGINGLLFHDFTCFNDAGRSHQIDTIYVCNHFILIIEAKNITGQLHFNENTHQLIRYDEHKKPEPFNSPVDQVKRHQHLIKSQFALSIPVEAAIVITNSKCIIGPTNDEIPIFFVSGLRSKIIELMQKHKTVQLDTQYIHKRLKKLYRPFCSEPWRQQIDYKTGILCIMCNRPMQPTNNGFKCQHCNLYDTDHLAVRRTLHDYRLLHGPDITNPQFRHFSNISSRYTAYSILSRLLPEKKGATRNFSYLIPENIYPITHQTLSIRE